jgi:multicomponent Na+:H+ antiporter subunit E
VANVDLARRIWSPGLPLRSGMLVVPTTQRSDGGLAATGLITSLIVGNQIVDVDRERNQLLYHAVDLPHGNRQHPEDDVNAPIERLIAPLAGR